MPNRADRVHDLAEGRVLDGAEGMQGEKRGALSRREFLKGLSAAGIAGGVLGVGACRPRDRPDRAASEVGARGPEVADGEAADRLPWIKDPAPFIRHPTNLETKLEDLDGFLTPNELFFVRNHAPTPILDVKGYHLEVSGDAVERPIELSYEDLLRLPSHSVVGYLECAGNWRGLYPAVMGQTASGGQWNRGAVGCASWSGVSLGTVLQLAGVKATAVDVNLFGLDAGAFNRPMPLATALERDTLLAYAMNGQDLPPDHGFPIRGFVPGWPGSNSVKWVSRIEVSSERQWVKNNTTSYVLIGSDWPADRYAPAEGQPITSLNVKSALALPWPGRLPAGEQRLRGFAYSPSGPVRGVEWRVDDSEWRPARLIEPLLPRAWARFELTWKADPGEHVVQTRATDAAGDEQPLSQPPNAKGYLLNVALPHPVSVA